MGDPKKRIVEIFQSQMEEMRAEFNKQMTTFRDETSNAVRAYEDRNAQNWEAWLEELYKKLDELALKSSNSDKLIEALKEQIHMLAQQSEKRDNSIGNIDKVTQEVQKQVTKMQTLEIQTLVQNSKKTVETLLLAEDLPGKVAQEVKKRFGDNKQLDEVNELSKEMCLHLSQYREDLRRGSMQIRSEFAQLREKVRQIPDEAVTISRGIMEMHKSMKDMQSLTENFTRLKEEMESSKRILGESQESFVSVTAKAVTCGHDLKKLSDTCNLIYQPIREVAERGVVDDLKDIDNKSKEVNKILSRLATNNSTIDDLVVSGEKINKHFTNVLKLLGDGSEEGLAKLMKDINDHMKVAKESMDDVPLKSLTNRLVKFNQQSEGAQKIMENILQSEGSFNELKRGIDQLQASVEKTNNDLVGSQSGPGCFPVVKEILMMLQNILRQLSQGEPQREVEKLCDSFKKIHKCLEKLDKDAREMLTNCEHKDIVNRWQDLPQNVLQDVAKHLTATVTDTKRQLNQDLDQKVREMSDTVKNKVEARTEALLAKLEAHEVWERMPEKTVAKVEQGCGRWVSKSVEHFDDRFTKQSESLKSSLDNVRDTLSAEGERQKQHCIKEMQTFLEDLKQYYDTFQRDHNQKFVEMTKSMSDSLSESQRQWQKLEDRLKDQWQKLEDQGQKASTDLTLLMTPTGDLRQRLNDMENKATRFGYLSILLVFIVGVLQSVGLSRG